MHSRNIQLLTDYIEELIKKVWDVTTLITSIARVNPEMKVVFQIQGSL